MVGLMRRVDLQVCLILKYRGRWLVTARLLLRILLRMDERGK